jgi:xanthine dehydrogenase iron-sulfur cluster and FAD-binding subunit A
VGERSLERSATGRTETFVTENIWQLSVTIRGRSANCESRARESDGVQGANKNFISFVLNGEKISVSDIDPRMLLLDLLRSPEIGLTGTKLNCGEGGCGACTVSLAYLDPETAQIVEGPVNACLRPLCSIDGMADTTTEGIGYYRKINPIQQRIVEHNASQCGFCTPGFVMCLYGMLRSQPNPSSQDVENFFDGNLCRCTGFRPILDAMQSFVGDDQPRTRGHLRALVARKLRKSRRIPESLSPVPRYEDFGVRRRVHGTT